MNDIESMCIDRLRDVYEAYKDAIDKAGDIVYVYPDDIKRANVIRLAGEYNPYRSDKSVIDVCIENAENATHTSMSLDDAKEFIKKFTNVVNKLDTMENTYLATVEKFNKERQEASKQIEVPVF